MSVSSAGGSTSAYSYLQALLQQQQGSDSGNSVTGGDPIKELLAAFYPSGSSAGSAPASTTSSTGSSSGSGCVSFSPDTMASLISVQGQQWSPDQSIASRAHTLFGEFDADGDGSISKSEFENVFGSGADTSKVDGLFGALDANGDGSISEDELTSAAKQTHANHHHHHGMSGAEGGLAALLSSSDLTGATTQTSSNADGSSSTTITYADGSTVTMTTPASGSSGASADSSTGQSQSGGFGNLLERLIKMQADLLSSTVNQSSLATV